MALPILILSFTPALFKYLPAWPMDGTFKQFMAFHFTLALSFLWVLGNQVGVMGMSLCVECLHSICTCSLALPAALNYGFITSDA